MSNRKITQERKNHVRKRLDFDEEPKLEPENHENHFLDLSKMTEQQRMEHRLKWNFDFENEVPLDGDWEWEKVVPEPPSRTVIDHKHTDLVIEMQKKCSDDRNV
ncbi:unnamed protein product [Ceutorhynchus assimilis]|uniref:Cyclin-dependent kinase inhibitor domain-containing protein n=1 Tax=Ceutorhynchus assimilis TaxID=467358 RepID=A0A9N9MDP7_9CUCU|nr:unnamed protein product [Ceutorhynchus assimilis]